MNENTENKPAVDAATPETETPAVKKSRRKLIREQDYDKGLISFTAINGEAGKLSFDFNKLPEDIQRKLGPLGLNHRLGDAAAGLAGKDAEEAINKVWAGLMKGDWTVRKPAAPKMDVAAVKEKYSKMSKAEQDASAKLLAQMGVNIPGINA